MQAGQGLLPALALFGCRKRPSDAGKDDARASPVASSEPQEDIATVERCGPGFQGRIIIPAGDVLQRETAQTKACPGDECPGRALGMVWPGRFTGKTCAEARESLAAEPIVDAWGAQARVVCDREVIQAISPGRDGKLGSCDDLARFATLQVSKIRR